MSDDLKARAERCVTHHHACDCREWDHAREIERLQAEVEKYKVAYLEYTDRTEWVQRTAKPRELGMHRADVLRLRVEAAETERDELRARLDAFVSDDDV